jgi:hypothetical protein
MLLDMPSNKRFEANSSIRVGPWGPQLLRGVTLFTSFEIIYKVYFLIIS